MHNDGSKGKGRYLRTSETTIMNYHKKSYNILEGMSENIIFFLKPEGANELNPKNRAVIM
jgi:hypothetical protein